MADAPDLGSGPERGGSSSLPARTNFSIHIQSVRRLGPCTCDVMLDRSDSVLRFRPEWQIIPWFSPRQNLVCSAARILVWADEPLAILASNRPPWLVRLVQ